MEDIPQVCLRVSALGLAFLSGWGFGSTVPIWQLDRWNELERDSEGTILDLSDPLGTYRGCGSGIAAALAELRAGCSASAFAWLMLLVGALFLAALGWPPLWLNPLKSDPFEFFVVTLLQRWIWFTLGAHLAGLVASGTAHMISTWFKR